jgi:hypothetical protein
MNGVATPLETKRVEHKNGVHQDRLVKKMRRNGLARCVEANAFLQTEYMLALNEKFRPQKRRAALPAHVTSEANPGTDGTFESTPKRGHL